MIAPKNLVVIGNVMVGHCFLKLAVEAELAHQFNTITFCEKPRYAYDRVYLSNNFSGKTAGDLSLLSKRAVTKPTASRYTWATRPPRLIARQKHHLSQRRDAELRSGGVGDRQLSLGASHFRQRRQMLS